MLILRWTDIAYGQHYLEAGGSVTLLGSYAHGESRPNHGKLYDRSTYVVADPPGTRKGEEVRAELCGEYGDNSSGNGEALVSPETSLIAVLFAPEYGGPDEGVLQISCIAMYLMNEHGDTVDTLVRQR